MSRLYWLLWLLAEIRGGLLCLWRGSHDVGVCVPLGHRCCTCSKATDLGFVAPGDRSQFQRERYT